MNDASLSYNAPMMHFEIEENAFSKPHRLPLMCLWPSKSWVWKGLWLMDQKKQQTMETENDLLEQKNKQPWQPWLFFNTQQPSITWKRFPQEHCFFSASPQALLGKIFSEAQRAQVTSLRGHWQSKGATPKENSSVFFCLSYWYMKSSGFLRRLLEIVENFA